MATDSLSCYPSMQSVHSGVALSVALPALRMSPRTTPICGIPAHRATRARGAVSIAIRIHRRVPRPIVVTVIVTTPTMSLGSLFTTRIGALHVAGYESQGGQSSRSRSSRRQSACGRVSHVRCLEILERGSVEQMCVYGHRTCSELASLVTAVTNAMLRGDPVACVAVFESGTRRVTGPQAELEAVKGS